MSAVRPLLVALVVAAIAVACDRSPTGVRTAPPAPPAPPATTLSAALVKPSGLVSCSQSYDSTTKVIGPKGGYLAVGSHYLIIDSLVLQTPVSITAVAPSSKVRWVRFRPDGLQFPASRLDGWGAILFTNYSDCGLTTTTSPRIAQVTDVLAILTYLQTSSLWSNGGQSVAVLLPHFSNYAVAW